MALVRKYQNNFTTGAISPGVYARVDLSKYANGCKRVVNGVVRAHGGISNRPGTLYVDTLPGPGLLFPFSYSVSDAYAMCFYDPNPNGAADRTAVLRVYRNGARVPINDENPDTYLEYATPYLPEELAKVKFVQSADVLFMVHPNHKPQMLTRSIDGDGRLQFTFEDMTFQPAIAAPTGLTATPKKFSDSSGTYYTTYTNYKVSAVSEKEEESLPSASAQAKTLSTWPVGSRVNLSWDPVPGAIRYEVYKESRGYYAYIGSSEETSFTDNNIEGDGSIGPMSSEDPFTGPGDYPGAIGIYQQRLVLGRTDNQPQTVWMTETGNFKSMAVAEPLRDDSAITATVDSRQMNEIRHFVPLRNVIMMTSGAEFLLSPGRNSDAITPTSVSFSLQSYWGCNDVPPIVSGVNILFCENSGRVVRDMKYAMADDAYTGEEVSILAEHLLESPVVDWAFQQSPFSTVWICLASGKLLTFTYMKEQEIWAWSEHESVNTSYNAVTGKYESVAAKFLSVAAIRERAADNVYFLTKRKDQYILEFQRRWDYGEPIEEAFYVDCGKTYRFNSATAELTGLDHLQGQKVVALADGSVVRGLTVNVDGTLTLPNAAEVVHIGLPYTTIIETLDPEIRAENGTTVGEPKNISHVTLYLRETRGLRVGPTERELVEVKFPPPEHWNEAPPLFTGMAKVVIKGHHRDEATIVFEQADPLPMTVLSVMTAINVG
jgi:hypothetical protein